VIVTYTIKGRVQCFSMQFVINKCFFLNPEKNLAQIRLVVFAKNAHFNSENDVKICLYRTRPRPGGVREGMV